jgi:hypothetical protein
MPREVDVAAPVVAYLQDLKFDVYQEVNIPGKGRADIVAVMGQLVWIIEVKASMSLAVLEQALNWKPFAHKVSVATPHPKWKHKTFGARLCSQIGLGLFYVTRNNVCQEERHAPFTRKVYTGLVTKNIHEEQKTWGAAGNATHSYYTPFRGTVLALTEYVSQHPGCGLSEAIGGIKSHYKTNGTAKSCLVKYLENGIIDTIRMEREGKIIKLYLKGEA